MICQWDPFNAVIVSEFSGIIQYESIEEGVSFRAERDDQTGNVEKIVIESKKKKKVPTINVLDEDGDVMRSYNLPVGSHILTENGDSIVAGSRIAKIPRQLGKIQDITGGLPRVTELFEARNPSNPAVTADIDGVVSFGKIKRGKREVFVEDEKTKQRHKYLCLLYTSPSPRDLSTSRMPSSA